MLNLHFCDEQKWYKGWLKFIWPSDGQCSCINSPCLYGGAFSHISVGSAKLLYQHRRREENQSVEYWKCWNWNFIYCSWVNYKFVSNHILYNHSLTSISTFKQPTNSTIRHSCYTEIHKLFKWLAFSTWWLVLTKVSMFFRARTFTFSTAPANALNARLMQTKPKHALYLTITISLLKMYGLT